MRFINAIHGCFVPTTSRTYGRATLIRCLSEQICDKTIYKVSKIIVQFEIFRNGFLDKFTCDINLDAI